MAESVVGADMAVADLDLDSFLDDISQRDDFLKKMTGDVIPVDLPPVRGSNGMDEPKPTEMPVDPAPPLDDTAIWAEEEVAPPRGPTSKLPGQAAKSAAASAPAPDGKPVKPRQRKHAYEYFNQWDAYDVDGELTKLEDRKPAAAPDPAPAPENHGLPPGLTAAMLAAMPTIEVERRALNEKNKGNEFYKASEYKQALQCYTHSLRLQQVAIA